MLVLGARGATGYVLGRGAGSAANWWEAGGATNCVAAYQPKGAASLAASYVNLANPGVFDAAPGVAPTWDAATGWSFNGSTQYLRSGVPGSAAVSFLMRFSDCSGVIATIGAAQTSPIRYTVIRPRNGGSRQIYLSANDSFSKAGVLASGVFRMGRL